MNLTIVEVNKNLPALFICQNVKQKDGKKIEENVHCTEAFLY